MISEFPLPLNLISWLKLLRVFLKLQSTPDISNLQGKSKKVPSYREFQLSGARRK